MYVLLWTIIVMFDLTHTFDQLTCVASGLELVIYCLHAVRITAHVQHACENNKQY